MRATLLFYAASGLAALALAVATLPQAGERVRSLERRRVAVEDDLRAAQRTRADRQHELDSLGDRQYVEWLLRETYGWRRLGEIAAVPVQPPVASAGPSSSRAPARAAASRAWPGANR